MLVEHNRFVMDRFEAFWQAYPRKVAKIVAMRAFRKLNPNGPTFDQMLAALERQKRGWTDLRFTPHASTWLNQERWTDADPEPPARTGSLAMPRWYDDCTHVPACANRAEHELRAAKMEMS